MATRKPIDPADSPRVVLEGRVVTMNGNAKVIANGRVYTQNGDIVAVQEATAPAPAGFGNTPVTETGGTIYPGLIDLHNHMPYNVLPLWQVPKKFGNRGQWGRHAEYHSKISAPMQTLAATPELLASICRYVEAKALIGGTTTGQGITLANQSGIRRYFRGVVRNVEATDDEAALPAASTRVPDVAAKDAQTFLTRLKKEKTCYLLHLSEGTDATARRAFQSLQIGGASWAITPSLCGIHAAALQAPDFQVLAANGGSMVWSPFSNMLLYGGTADIAAAKAAGVPISLGCDWAPSGSRNLLNELKVAHILSEANGAIFTPRELVAMVTRASAGLLGWERVVGSVEVGKRADLIVVEGAAGDPYQQLIRAKESDLALVMINGVGRFGDAALMRKLGFAGETLKVGGTNRMLFLAHPAEDPLTKDLTLSGASDRLTRALRGLPALARKAERPRPISLMAMARAGANTWRLALDEILDTGVEMRANLPVRVPGGRTLRAAAMRPVFAETKKLSAVVMPLAIDALTVVDDAGYLDALDAQRNVPDTIKEGLRDLWS
ncbi:amidohydrolase family protein [Variovorax sp. J22G21]|uniref:amidohydrolase family protein n=1 Tax=Variovorax fucosicus TaxID=3053517 RepID=UPI002577C87C|nr:MULTISPECIES: amidohydrolase family protein [unclassified Variovorax]MDM0039389.1 amidohydrolase family protein [Variovorax sp. J22R193]MDM0064163.1 amidohydrolase family protein [Variovorax sp. J22G21]